MNDRRRHRRIALETGIEIEIDGIMYQAQLKDISIKGALVSSTDIPPQINGREAVIRIKCGPAKPVLVLDAKVAYHFNGRFGFQFIIDKEDLMERLYVYIEDAGKRIIADRRKHQRIILEAQAEITSDGKRFIGNLKDISLQGALIQCREFGSSETGAPFRICVHLRKSHDPLLVEAELAYAYNDTYGFIFRPTDPFIINYLKSVLYPESAH